LGFWGTSVQADGFRVTTFAAPLSRDGPRLLLRDLNKADDDSPSAIAAAIMEVEPDVLVLTDFDYDLDGIAFAAFADMFEGLYPFMFARTPNAGLATGYDLYGKGRTGDAGDTQGYGRIAGEGGLAILSRYPIEAAAVIDLSTQLWRDVPDAVLLT
jgi:hypothetical protein